ncbi:hypothetical protein BCR33DRAFT_846030 [Rhizoclosmatium globosum]|uniref:Pentacotripeptide-repeat region of PRORP domain-containing protein n=1 Tax=Rhizoclosmatium globosum TaxID=329046 RepID=A0A1Y2CYM9_9FUNG|nr:hypothetical protein BCR33DRAFT_846030 [Rhizoclosmatium globosum]|eukprot:ORY52067.1 hypothetical protein BCR33DRAFT_846030 [Rhizoclosmatium globosum]
MFLARPTAVARQMRLRLHSNHGLGGGIVRGFGGAASGGSGDNGDGFGSSDNNNSNNRWRRNQGQGQGQGRPARASSDQLPLLEVPLANSNAVVRQRPPLRPRLAGKPFANNNYNSNFSKKHDPNQDASERLLTHGRPLISASDVKPISNDGYQKANSSPVESTTSGNSVSKDSTTNQADAQHDAFDHADRMATLNPPNWPAFFMAVQSKDAITAWLSFKDILFSEKEKLNVKIEHVRQMLHLLSRCKPYPKVKCMLETMEFASQLKLPADLESQNLLLEAYSRIGDYDSARKVILTFGELGLVPNLRTYNLFLELYIKEGNLNACIAFYERMIDEGVEPDVNTFNSLIQGCLKFQKLNRVESYFQEMVALGIDPNQRTINLLIQHYAKNTKPTENPIQKIESLVSTYIRDPLSPIPASSTDGKVDPNAAIYTALIKAYTTHNRIDLARSAFSTAKTLPDADAHLYTAMLHSLVESGNKSSSTNPHDQELVNEEALSLFQEMMDNPTIQVDSVAFATLVQMFVHSRDLERAELVVNVGMKARGVPVTFAVWSSLLEGYVESGRVSDAVRLFEQMRMEGAYPPTYLYNLVLRGLASDFDTELLERYWGRWMWSIEVEEAELTRQKESFRYGQGRKNYARKVARPDAESYSIIVEAFVACQDIERAIKEVGKMVQKGFMPAEKTFLNLVEANVRRRDYKGAAETMLLMRTAVDAAAKKGGSASATNVKGLNDIIKGNAGQFESLVVGLLEKSESLNGATDIAPNATPKQLAKLKEFVAENSGELAAEMKAKRTLGVELYKEMISAGCVPTESTFQCVIRAHNRAGDLVSAIKAWMSFRSLHPNVVPQHATVNALLVCVKELGKQASARAVVDMIQKEKLKLDTEGFGLYLFLLARWGWKEELMSCVLDMVNDGVAVSIPMVQLIEQGLKAYKGLDAAATEKDVMGFIEENWPEALAFAEEEKI